MGNNTSNFTYNEESRIHTLGDSIIPSVSQVIQPLTDFSGIPEAVLQRKRDLGIQFHEAVRLHLLDDLLFESLDSDLVLPVKAFIKFWSDMKAPFSNLTIEESLCHSRLKYCGKPDLVTPTAIYDWKLRPYKPVTDILQLEAYKHMLKGFKGDRWAICVTLDGKLTMHKAQHRQAWSVFRQLLERWYSEREFNKLIGAWKGIN